MVECEFFHKQAMERLLAIHGVPPADVEVKHMTGTTKIAGDNLKFTYTTPSREELLSDPNPLLLNHGWFTTGEIYQGLANAVAQRGKSVITYSRSDRPSLCDINPLVVVQAAKLMSMDAWAVMRKIKDEMGHKSFDIYGHSLGGRTSVDIATHKPEYIGSVLLDGSCGLNRYGLRKEIQLLFGEFIPHELLPSIGRLALLNAPQQTAKTIYRAIHSPLRTAAEGIDAGTANLHEGLQKLSKMGKGRIAIHSQQDAFFPLEAVRHDSHHLFNIFEVRRDPCSQHIAPITDPEDTADIIISVLDQIHKRKPELSLAA
jgi:pimeloyl-ACP methyl ester carboxylesterase